jgi:hypothetical protein
MAKRDELLDGRDGIAGDSAPVFGQQMWNYYVRSYPDVVEKPTTPAPHSPRRTSHRPPRSVASASNG